MKKILFLSFLIISMILVSCGGGDNKSEQIQVTFWHSMGGPLGNALATLIQDYNDSQSEVFIEGVSVGNYTALTQKLTASIQAGNQPDIAQLYESSTVDYVKAGVLVPVEKFIKQDAELQKELETDFYSVFMKSNIYKGQMWTFPFNKSVRVLYYNKDMFLKYGYDPYQVPTTWEEFIDYAKVISAVKDENGDPVTYVTNLNSSATQFVNLVLQAGGNILEDGKPLFNGIEGVEALEYLRTLVVEMNVAYLAKGYEGQNDFLAEKVAMYEGSSVSMAFMASNKKLKFNVGIAPIPHNRTVKNVISGTNIAIFSSNEKKEEASWKFIKWLTEKEQTAKWSYLTYYMPLRKSALEVSPLKDRLEENEMLFDVYDQLNYAETEPAISEWRLTRKYIEKNVLEAIYDTSKDVTRDEIQILLNAAADELEKRIKKNNGEN